MIKFEKYYFLAFFWQNDVYYPGSPKDSRHHGGKFSQFSRLISRKAGLHSYDNDNFPRNSVNLCHVYLYVWYAEQDRCVKVRKDGSRLDVTNGDSTDKVREKYRIGQDVKAWIREMLSEMKQRPTEMMVDKKWGDVDRHGRACRLAESSGCFGG